MFRWYRDAEVCFAFLSDVSIEKSKVGERDAWESAFRRSRWFTRGWTLHELIAPDLVSFYSQERTFLGDRNTLGSLIQEITELPLSTLIHNEPALFTVGREDRKRSSRKPFIETSVEQRLFWSAKRTTSRPEDKAYSLLGICDVYMPLTYGEGQVNAFRRLCKEIKGRKYVTTASVYFTEQYDCLRSLAYLEQEQRLNDIHTAVKTCEWIFNDPQYIEWYKGSCVILWIKGKPGVGKSVLMKHAFKQTRIKEQHELGVVVSTSIHGQGTELQRSPLGAMRALPNQLLDQFPDNLTELTKVHRDREKRFGPWTSGRWTWSLQELQEALSNLLLNETRWRRVTLFVDALDECGDKAARLSLAYFRDLVEQGKTVTANLKLCLASRHSPIIGQTSC